MALPMAKRSLNTCSGFGDDMMRIWVLFFVVIASSANAGKQYQVHAFPEYNYNIYKSGKLVHVHKSGLNPKTFNKILPPGYSSVPQNAGPHYPSWQSLWGTATRIPQSSSGRGGPCHKCPVVR